MSAITRYFRYITRPLAQNREKLTPPPLFRKCPQWLILPTPCSCGHTINFEKSGFLHQKVRTSASEEPPAPLSEKCPHWTNPLPPGVRKSFMVDRIMTERSN